MMNFGARVKSIRKGKGIKAKFVAQKIGLSPSDYSQLESGRRRLTAELVVEISRVLGVTADELLILDISKPRNTSVDTQTAKCAG